VNSLHAFFRSVTLAKAVVAAGGVFIAGVVLAGALTLAGYRSAAIGGPVYEQIVESKDLLGDVLPPPLYLVEAYLEANLVAVKSGSVAEHQAHVAELRKAYEDRRAYWRASRLPDALKRDIDTAAASADAIWREFDASFFPAALAGDAAKLDASLARMHTAYATHRDAINTAVNASNAYVASVETQVAARSKEVRTQIAAVFGLLILGMIGGVFVLARKVAYPVAAAADRLSALAARMGRYARASRMQMQLDAHLVALRSALNQRGAPRTQGDKLYFGDYLVNGETEIVDAIKRQYGGLATIFLGDVRIATNVTDDSGRRAVGSRLPAGAVQDALFRDGASFQGEAQVLGRNHVAIYEPFFIDDKPAGAIFVGVPFAEDEAQVHEAAVRNEVVRMVSAHEIVDAAIVQKDKVEKQALDDRIRAADESRRSAARAVAAQAQQRIVVDSLSGALQSLAENDLTYRIEVEFPGEYRSLKVNFAQAVQTLSQTIGALVAQGRAIGDISAELTEHADQLTQRSAAQAANLEQSAAAVTEVAESSKRAAEGADHARSIVGAADSEAGRGAGVVKEAVGAMRAIADSAAKIGQIVSLIDEIAFQTNLLALNAGVEAARAGEAGRGFAVVASEVRALALRSAEAAKDIRTLIATSSEGVGRGVELVTRSGEALERIVQQVGEINGVIGNIASGSKEQAHALEEVSSAVSEMDQATQANAAVAQRSAEAAKSLRSEAEQLNALVARFRLVETRASRSLAA